MLFNNQPIWTLTMKNILLGIAFVTLVNAVMVEVFGPQAIIVGMFLCLLIGWNNDSEEEEEHES